VDDFPRPIATVDVALFTLSDGALAVLLARREREPYAGQLALPGGFVHVDEDDDTAQTAARVLAQKVGVARPYLEQLYTFSGKVRDPRGWSLAVAYYALLPQARLAAALAGEGGLGVSLVPVDRLPALPFDHARIIAAALARLRGKSTYSALPAYLLPEQFTIQELHQVYQQVMGVRLDKASFRRKIEDQEIVEPIAGERRGGAHRPAQLYRLRTDRKLEFERKI
jgi:ADP-ribose pyrophosphatase YjhB (NUDIX family)